MQIFAIVVSFAMTFAAMAILVPATRRMLGVIRAGQPAPGRTGNPVGRSTTMLKETFLHTRMLQRPWIGVMHWFVYAAFLFLSTAVGAAYFQLFEPSFAWPLIGHWYPYEWFSELIGLLSTVGIVFLILVRQRHHPRSEGRGSRFFGSNFWQAYFVEALALLEGAAILFVRAAEWKLDEDAGRSHYPISSWIGDAFYPNSVGALENTIYAIAAFKIVLAMIWLMVIARNLTMGIAWHRFTAWPNIWFKREDDGSTAIGAMKPLTSEGKPVTLDDIDDLDEESVLGAGKLEDFSWKGILDFTTCTECGRCQSQCPAWNTEKPLSPKLLITALRDHAYAKADGDPAHTERQLVGVGSKGETAGAGTDVIDYFYNPHDAPFVIDEDVLWNCTSCGACVQQCPVDIEHVDHIMDMRRYQLLVESNFPAELNQLFKGLENKGNPWNMSATARMDWAKGLEFDVPVVGEDLESLESVDWLFWVGCAGAYEDRAKKTTRAVAELLDIAGISFGVLGNGETCTGDPARRAGNEFVFQGLAQQNVETFKEYKVKKVVSTCAHCFNTLKNEYKDFGIELEVVHHTQLLNRLVREGKLTPVKDGAGAAKRSITYHDPCYVGRHNQVYSPPRELLQVLPGAEYVEMERSAERSFCCGAGGARMWMEENLGERINVNRTREAVGTGADQIAVGCPFCRVMLSDGLTAQQAAGEAREEVEVLDVAQMLLASVKGESATKAAPASSPAAAAPAAKAGGVATDVATKDEPEAGDVTVTENTVTETADAGPLAKASGGSSLFDTPAPEAPATPAAPAEKAPASSGSLFDTPAPEAPAAPAEKAPASGGSLFDTPAAEAPAAPAEKAPASGSLFDTPAPEAPAAPAEKAPEAKAAGGPGGSSLFDLGPAEPEAPAPAPAPAPVSQAGSTELGGGGSLFDLGTPEEPAPTAAPAPEAAPAPSEPTSATPAATAAPAASLGSGESLFDIAAPAPVEPATKAEPAAKAEPVEPVEPVEQEVEAKPEEPAAQAGATDLSGVGSLFDLEAPASPEPTAVTSDDAAAPATGSSHVPAEPETILDEPDEEEPEEEAEEAPAKPAPSQGGPAPRTDVDISGSGSLFDL
ncbi:(Fe-S)-binding protein [Nocardioides sp. S-58]|uniref:(Fe-S)-binding protein n=1 Tax=Nocardioides renjunii TaxID=3095075 RepID=A0ABU5K7X3_9ACTN|nr:(Fe-S)-binding protein [Nocardioides sp. S-58]MDZ5661062.1 (Fe-S)-binding protein [Nocardioides sp. S-58]